MVSKVAYRPSDAMIDIYTYHIPWIIPATKPTVSFPTATTRTTTTKMMTTDHTKQSGTTTLSMLNHEKGKNPVGFDPYDEVAMSTKLQPDHTTTTTSTPRKEQQRQQPQQPQSRRTSLLDPTSDRAKHIIYHLKGDFSKYTGHLPIGYQWPYYVLDIQTPKNIPEPDL
jgi:hypothetical protein